MVRLLAHTPKKKRPPKCATKVSLGGVLSLVKLLSKLCVKKRPFGLNQNELISAKVYKILQLYNAMF